MSTKILILDSKQAEIKLLRLAYEIVENNIDEKEIILAGIIDRGLVIATLLKKKIESISAIQCTVLAIVMDKNNPVDSSIDTKISLDKKSIVIVDDVANSGRTLLYGLHPFLNVIAKKIQIAVLVDRKHKSYPVCADYIGMQVSTTLQEHIKVEIQKNKIVGAYLV